MRIRSTKPDFWKSDDVAALKDWHDRLVFIGLWNYVDDNGVGRDNERLITAELFGLEDDPREASSRVRRALANLANRGLIVRYEDSTGQRYVSVTNWHHQKIDRPSKPRYPLPTRGNTLFDEGSSSIHRGLDADSLRAPEDQGSGIRDQGSEDQGINHPSSAEPMAHAKYPVTFERFWKLYPRKVGKPAAFKAWTQARKRAEGGEIMTGVERLATDPNLPEEQFIPHPTTWLRRDGWNDAPYPPPTNGRGPKQSTTDERVGQGIALARKYAEQEAREERLEVTQ